MKSERMSIKQSRSVSIKQKTQSILRGSVLLPGKKKSVKKSFFGLKLLNQLLGKKQDQEESVDISTEERQEDDKVGIVEVNGIKMFNLTDLEKRSYLEQDVLLKSFKFILKPSLTLEDEENDPEQLDFPSPDDALYMIDQELLFEDLSYLNTYDIKQRKDVLQKIYGPTLMYQTIISVSLPYQKEITFIPPLNPIQLHENQQMERPHHIRPMESVRIMGHRKAFQAQVASNRIHEQLYTSQRKGWLYLRQILHIAKVFHRLGFNYNWKVLEGDLNELRERYLQDRELLDAFTEGSPKWKLRRPKIYKEVINDQFI